MEDHLIHYQLVDMIYQSNEEDSQIPVHQLLEAPRQLPLPSVRELESSMVVQQERNEGKRRLSLNPRHGAAFSLAMDKNGNERGFYITSGIPANAIVQIRTSLGQCLNHNTLGTNSWEYLQWKTGGTIRSHIEDHG